ncbi:GNAT family N-acetyltransferase [Lacticaseibacillus sharpeae]|uniref:GNAT family N-acetyltransferase n=1 Tax=Lacticaseibacillus sharpeae TaxID=1626 RepID=UPI0006CF9328|nr:GNAT family N-acetyltransferase [Lacticaseibacillus sharpeae]
MENFQISAPADRDAFYQLYLYAFNKQDSVQRHEFFDARFNHATDYGIHAGGQLVSALYSLPFTVNFAGQEFKMRGIGVVCSAPEFSGRGGAGTLMTAALQDMYAEARPCRTSPRLRSATTAVLATSKYSTRSTMN